MIFPQSIRQGDTGRRDQNGFGCAEQCTSVSPWLEAADPAALAALTGAALRLLLPAAGPHTLNPKP